MLTTFISLSQDDIIFKNLKVDVMQAPCGVEMMILLSLLQYNDMGSMSFSLKVKDGGQRLTGLKKF